MESIQWSRRFFSPSSPSSAEWRRAPLQVAHASSRGSTEMLGGLVGVTDGQADGSNVFYGLKVAEKRHLYKQKLCGPKS